MSLAGSYRHCRQLTTLAGRRADGRVRLSRFCVAPRDAHGLQDDAPALERGQRRWLGGPPRRHRAARARRPPAVQRRLGVARHLDARRAGGRDRAAAQLRDHLAPRCGQDHDDREAAAVSRDIEMDRRCRGVAASRIREEDGDSRLPFSNAL